MRFSPWYNHRVWEGTEKAHSFSWCDSRRESRYSISWACNRGQWPCPLRALLRNWTVGASGNIGWARWHGAQTVLGLCGLEFLRGDLELEVGLERRAGSSVEDRRAQEGSFTQGREEGWSLRRLLPPPGALSWLQISLRELWESSLVKLSVGQCSVKQIKEFIPKY